MELPTYPLWATTHSKTASRNRRLPEESALYSLVYNYHEELQYVWEDRFQSEYGMYRAEVEQAFLDYLDCGILIHGCSIAACESCDHAELIAFSCKRRGLCPSCDAKRAVMFAEHLYSEVLKPVPCSHVVFTIPKRLRVFFKYNRKLTHHLYTAAWNSWSELIDDALPECQSGMIMSLHTAGDLLNFHPHVHGLSVHGGIDSGGNFHSLTDVDTVWLSQVFARNVFEALLQEELLERETVEQMQSWRHSGFNVWVGEPVEYDNTDSVKFLSRYLKKGSLFENRLEFVEETQTVQYHKLSSSGSISETREFEPLNFLAELSQHIPGKWEQTTRYFGAYSARTRGARRINYASSDIAEPLPEPVSKPSASWAAAMKQIFEFDPLVCPKCGSNMKIKSIITDSAEIKKILKYYNLSAWRAPPAIKKTDIAA
jgi:hypothetical protein